MKILITHAYAKENKGDAAILSVLLMQLNEAFPKSTITVSMFDDTVKNHTFEGYQTISSFLYLAYIQYKNTTVKIAYSLYILAITIAWAVFYRCFTINARFLLSKPVSNITDEFLRSDLIVPIGGGYIRSKPTIKDTFNLLLILHPIFLSVLLRKPVVLYSQSIGPFYGPFQKTITRIILNYTNLILVREDNTMKTLNEIGVKKILIKRTVDAGFLFESTNKSAEMRELISQKNHIKKIIVGITVRKWLHGNKQKAYEASIAAFIYKIVKEYKDIVFVFIPQVTSVIHNDDDRDVAKRIFAMIKDKKCVVNMTGVYDHHQVKAFYSNLDFIIGTRFHSVIFSLTAYVPALAIEYEYKTSGIMKDLGLGEWVIMIEDVTADLLYNKFTQLIKKRKEYEKILHKNLPAYIEKAKENVSYLKEAYKNF